MLAILTATVTTARRRLVLAGALATDRAASTLSPSTATTKKPRVVILGSGWGGNKLARALDPAAWDVRVISPANHFLFTPLLPSTAVGTLEFRAIQEPIRTIAGLGEYYQAKARRIDTQRRVVRCEDTFRHLQFDVKYDVLIVAAGCKTHTFGTPGVAELERDPDAPLYFLKHLYHARAIRQRVLECFERASSPAIDDAEKARLLTFVVVGGGATSCEFASELSDFVSHDISKWYPDLAPRARLMVVEAGPRLLANFDAKLVEKYTAGLAARRVDVRVTTAVRGVARASDDSLFTTLGASSVDAAVAEERVPFGMMVWSAGLAPVSVVETLTGADGAALAHSGGRIEVDEYLRVPGLRGRVFALGDCAVSRGAPLPPTASVAEQQASYLAKCFNATYARHAAALLAPPPAPDGGEEQGERGVEVDGALLPTPEPVHPSAAPFHALEFIDRLYSVDTAFRYVERGAMASMGLGGGVSDLTKTELLPNAVNPHTIGYSGVIAWATWAGTYATKQLSYSNMILIPMYWFKAAIFGRDISRF